MRLSIDFLRSDEERAPVPVIPMALTNLWGFYFSRVGLQVGPPIPADKVRPDILRTHVAELLAQA